MPPLSSKTLFTGSFPALQRRFAEATSAERRQDPLAPLIVLIPSQLLRLHLRRALARHCGGHANVRFLTLLELAREIAEPELKRQGQRRLSDALRGPLMSAAIESAGDLRYFSRVARRPGFRHAAWQTLKELRSAGVTLPQWRAVVSRLARSEDQIFPSKLADLTAVWEQFEALLLRHHYVDELTVLAMASAQAAAHAPEIPVTIYGFDSLTGLERNFTAQLSARRRTQIYLPYDDSPSCEWVRPLREHWLSLGCPEVVLEDSQSAEPSALSSLQQHLFKSNKREASPLDPQDRSVLFVSAPTRDREVDELSREILFSPQAQPHARRSVGVLLRDNARYVDLLRTGFAAAGIEGYFHQCQLLADQTAGRALRRLTALLSQTYRRSDVMEFLLSAPVKWPPSALENSSALPAAEWNHFSLLAGITSGEDAWLDGLQRLRRGWERQAQERDSDDEKSAVLAARVASVNAFINFLEMLFERVRDIAAQRSWEAKIARLWSLFVEIVETDESTPAVAEGLARASELDALGWEPTAERVIGFIADMLRTPVARTGKFQASEPTVCTYEESLGLCFDDVLLCGLVEKEIPRPAAEDPVLLDAERSRLQEFLSDVTLPLRSLARDRERFLFHSAVTSAHGRVFLSYPRFEGSEGRERLPSVYLLKALEALTGRTEDYDALAHFISEYPQGRYVSAGRLRASPLPPVTEMEALVRKLAAVLFEHDGRFLANEISRQPALARALRAEQMRFGQREFSICDGVMEQESLRTQWSETFGSLRRPLSPTRMERYATCPFQYFARDVLGLEEIEEASVLSGISPRTRGSLVHEILYTYYQQEISAHRLPWQDDAEHRLNQIAHKIFADVSRETLTGPALLWRLEQKRILEWLAALLQREKESTERFVPLRLEESFEISYDADSALRFRGKIDRVDLAPEGMTRVIDYKAGSVPGGMKNGSLNRGRALQLPVYRLAAEKLFEYRVQSAEYWYLSDRAAARVITFSDEDWEKNEAAFRKIVTTIASGIAGAQYYPFPEIEKCASCPVKLACGSGRWTDKWRHDLDTTRAFWEMTESQT